MEVYLNLRQLGGHVPWPNGYMICWQKCSTLEKILCENLH